MEGLTGALARISELQGRLSTLRPPSTGGQFDALLRSSATSAAASPAAPASSATASSSAAWAVAQRPAVLSGAGPAGPSLVAGGPAGAVGAASTDLRTYPNGRLPASALVGIGGGEQLRPPAAEAFLALRAAAARDGVDLPVNDSYRSFAEQEDMARRKGLYSQGGLAARPGTSTHGLGLSVDLQLDGEALAWMRDNGRRFGFVEDVPREPWHWTFTPAARG